MATGAFGHSSHRALVASERAVYPLHPTATEVEGYPAFVSIADLPHVPESLSIVTQPHITREIIRQAIAAGVKRFGCNPEQKIPYQARPRGTRDSMSSMMEVVYSLAFPSIGQQRRKHFEERGLAVKHWRNQSWFKHDSLGKEILLCSLGTQRSAD